jgi:IS5 family transposase
VIDRKGRPLRFLLSGGQCFDGKAAVPLLKPLPPPKRLLADKAYDCAAFRDGLSRRGTTPVIPNKINRRRRRTKLRWRVWLRKDLAARRHAPRIFAIRAHGGIIGNCVAERRFFIACRLWSGCH